MYPLCSRAPARYRWPSAVAAVVLAAAVLPSWAETDSAALTLGEVERLAVSGQPILIGLEAQASAALETAVAARQLPDPQLVTGIQDVPVNTSDAWSLRRDSDTQIQAGLMQEFPRAEKRRLRGELSEREAGRLQAEHHLAWRSVRRDAALAWLQTWKYDRTLRLTRDGLREAETQMQIVEIALRTGGATQAEFLTARQEADRLKDAVAAAEQSIAHARNGLSRWIGDEAFRPVTADLPVLPALPPLEVVLERVRQHPHLAGAAAQVAMAQTNADLAAAAYKPDWRVEVGYGYRPEFSEMAMLQVGIDLPVFTRNRQDRAVAAARAQQEAAAAAIDDASRQLLSEARLNHQDWERLTTRLKSYDEGLLPQSGNRVTASLAGWRSGRGLLRDVIDARRGALELQMARLDLQSDLAMHYIQLSYLGAFEDASGAGDQNHE
ncbi:MULTISPECIES: TolC family protein [Hydrocarboniphaga]|jgi:cobalt-zinc-cadmium efflux system outer membrane protein|uniref:TolC family protein n=1 Tax=Hydrocarboniphaga TaxID=243627 RepID=UPI0009FDDEF6|nr:MULTISPECIES: TolC family protein [Hydrocarboniphaga]MDZ4079819.1 TolC family protein [Hydrocarboniphaga sp.]